MNTPICCKSSLRLAERSLASSRWIIPAALLAVMPKCPACLAAAVFLWTGIGLSIRTAGTLRGVLLTVCVSALLLPVLRRVVSYIRLHSRAPTARSDS